jgi:hypothetical protein
MTRSRSVKSLVAAVALLGLGAVASARPPSPTSPAAAPFLARSFTIRADAFPVEPAPGTNETSVGVRPAGTRISVSNAPAAAYGRAAATDAGTIELYTGPPPPDTVAECDATAPNISRHATAAPGGMQLEAMCDTRPSARVVASGSGSGVSRSEAFGDGGGVALVAEALAVIDDAVVGPIRLGSVTYHAVARTTGDAGGATATGVVAVSDATVAGVPVTIGAGGVRVDKSKVPLDLVPAAADTVREVLSQGDYSDVRVVQPRTSVAPDGSRAEVSGGGVSVLGQNPDPANNYFLRLTLAGGSALVALGSESPSAFPAVSDLPARDTPLPDLARPGAVRPAPPAGADGSATASPPAASPAPSSDALALVASRHTVTLSRPWSGWVWAVVAFALGGGALFAQRRRLARWWDVAADRYVRG